MSGAVSALGLIASVGAGELNRLFFATQRSIGGISPAVTIAETHRDELRVTKHPVEQGAAITDHAWKENPQCEMRIGWTDAGLRGPGYAKQMYQSLIALQNSRTLIDVSTGKRMYSNMLITGVSTETSEGYENSAIVLVHLEQVLIVQLTTASVPPQANQSQPATSAPTQIDGQRSTSEVPPARQSALFSLFGTSVADTSRPISVAQGAGP